MGVLRRPRRKLFYALLVLSVSVAVVEAFCRFAEGQTDSLMGPYERGGADGGIGFAPGGHLDHEGIQTVFNEGAYVGPMRAIKSPDGVRRVVVLGDSFTFGWAIGPEHAWPALVDEALPNVEVLNFAVPGQNTWLELAHYRETARHWNADLVVVGWYVNDALVDRRSPNVHRLCPLPAPGLSRVVANAMEGIAAVRILYDLTNILDHGGPLPAWDAETLVNEDQFGFACSMHWLQEMKREVEVDGARFVVVQMPHLDGLQAEQDPEEAAQQRLTDALAARGVDQIPLYSTVAGKDPEAMQTPDLHPSAAAHRIFASTLSAAISERLGVDL